MDYQRVVRLDDIEIVPRSQGGDGRTVTAYAAVFNSPTQMRDHDGEYQEQIAPVAFNRSLAVGSRPIGVFYNHSKTVFGTPSESGSLPIGSPVDIRADGKGLRTTTRYNRTQLASDVLEAIKNGDITGHSFTGRFVESSPAKPPGGYGPDRAGTLPLVTRQQIDLLEYGPTPYPAYPDASVVGVRVEPGDTFKLWDSAERREFLAGLDARQPAGSGLAQRHADDLLVRALSVPALTGDFIRDVSVAQEHADHVGVLLEEAERVRWSTEAAALASADPADAAEAGRARVRYDMLASAYRTAAAHRDRLEGRDLEIDRALALRTQEQQAAVIDELWGWSSR